MLVKVISLCFAGGYNSVYEQAWNDNLESFIDYYNDEYDLKISEDDIKERDYQRYLEDCAVRWLDVCTDEKVKVSKQKEMIEIQYPIWGGTKRHPKIVGYETMTGEIKGDWCVSSLGRKKLSGNWIKVIKQWNI